jgi:predicted membrane GTPase involved in stress response
MSFKMAGRLAFRACMEQAKPALLEPVMHVEIEAPDESAGAIMGDLNSRRGRVQGMETAGVGTIIRALVPLAEMLSYGLTLTSMTQGRGAWRWTTTTLFLQRSQKRSLPTRNTTSLRTRKTSRLDVSSAIFAGLNLSGGRRRQLWRG